MMLIRDGDGGWGWGVRESEGTTRKTESVNRRQKNGSVKAVSPTPLRSNQYTTQFLFQLLC